MYFLLALHKKLPCCSKYAVINSNNRTSGDTEMYCPKGKCGCQYFILLTLKKKKKWTQGPGFFKIN